MAKNKVDGQLLKEMFNDSASQDNRVESEIVDCVVANLLTGRYQRRDHEVIDEAMLELVESIKAVGLIQPVLVRMNGTDYELVAGHRRTKAHEIAGIKMIKAIVVPDLEEKTFASMTLVENIQRKNLTAYELAISFKMAVDSEFFKDTAELARALGKSKGYISKIMSILNVAPKVLGELVNSNLHFDTESLYELQKIKNPVKQYEIFTQYSKNLITREGMRETVKDVIFGEKAMPSIRKSRDPEDFKVSKTKDVVTIRISAKLLNDGDLDEIIGLIKKKI